MASSANCTPHMGLGALDLGLRAPPGSSENGLHAGDGGLIGRCRLSQDTEGPVRSAGWCGLYLSSV